MTTTGYDYKGHLLCPDHMLARAARDSLAAGVTPSPGDGLETVLGDWARARGIDPARTGTYDSSTYPKPVSEDQAHDQCKPGNGCVDTCAICDTPLGGACTPAA